MLLRLVDITLILLFGFISISSIEKRTNIDLPEAENAHVKSAKIKTVEIIAIDEAGRLLIDEESVVIAPELLLPHLLICREQCDTVKVKIRAERGAAIMHVRLVAQLCDSLGISKSIEVRVRESVGQ